MIEVNYAGRFGNCIFQYAIARIIAEKNGYQIYSPHNRYPGLFPNIEGKKFTTPVETLSGHNIDLQTILDNKENRQIKMVCGYFHRSEYFLSHKHKIMEWINLKNIKPSLLSGENDLTIHIRGGDAYHKSYPATPYKFFKRIIEENSFRKIYVVTENHRDLVANKIRDNHNGILISNDFLSDFLFILNSKNIALSLSTFSWWAMFLGSPHNVYFPLIGVWHPEGIYKDSVDLRIDSPIFHYYDLGVYDCWNGSKSQMKEMLKDE